jgi:NitT/TauT family transport system substrate-binding protein
MTLDRRDFIKMAALAPASLASLSATAEAQELKTVRVIQLPTDGAKSVLYAQRANLFRKRGLTADITSLGSGAAVFAAVLGGSADFGAGSLFPVFSAYAHGLPLRIIAPASLYVSDHADTLLLVQKDAPFRQPSDLAGKTMGADAPNDIYSTSTRAWVDAHDGKSLKIVELKASAQLSSLDSGRIDMAVLKPPYLTQALDTGKFRVFGKPLDGIAPRFLLSCWVASVDFIQKNPAVVSNFVAGLTEAAKYTNANQAATVDLVAAFTGQDAGSLGRGVRSITAETVSLPEIQRPLDFAVKTGIIDQRIDLTGLLTSSFPLAR